MQLSNVKEEVYGALDSFIAWELEFPLVIVKKALKTLENQREWKRIIQVHLVCPTLSIFSSLMVSLSNQAYYIWAVGDKVDVKQRSRKNNGKLFHITKCLSRRW